jgi:predicted transcriptional regulator
MAAIINNQSTAAQIAQPGQEKERFLFWDKPAWMMKKPVDTTDRPITDQDSFYRRAIEWSHRADKVINLILGYLLAVASVLGFMDVLSGGEVLNHVPYLFYIWLGVMGLGVEFQIFLVIGRMPDLARTVQNWFFRFVFFAFNLGFLAFLCYMSVVIAAVFTQHRDVAGSSIGAAMNALGIDSTRFVFERAALATLLLVLMAIDRTMERWRMQIDQAAHVPTPAQNVPVVVAPIPVQEEDKIEKLLIAMQNMNAQNLQAISTQNMQTFQALQAQHQQAMVMTVEQITRVTVEAIEDRLAALPVQQLIAQSAIGTSGNVPSNTRDTEELEVVSDATEPIGSTENAAENSANSKRFGEAIQKIATEHPELSGVQIAERLGCTERTVYKWLKRVNVQE